MSGEAIAVVIVTYDSAGHIVRTLRALDDQLREARMAVAGLGLLWLTLGSVLLLVTDVVLPREVAVLVSAVFVVGTAALWVVPAALARR